MKRTHILIICTLICTYTHRIVCQNDVNDVKRVEANLLHSYAQNNRRFPHLPHVDTNVPIQHHIPMAVKGECIKNKVYRITNKQDLFDLRDEIECVYTAGIIPDGVPLGLHYGDVLLLLNTDVFNPIVHGLWRGKIATMTKCRQENTFISWNFVASRLMFPAALSIGKLDVALRDGEFDDGRDALLIDYTVDFTKVCPHDSEYTNTINMGVINDIYPINQIVDVVRIAGRQEDGGLIYLGKTYLKDAFNEHNGAITVAYWYVINYDDDINPEVKHGDPLPKLPLSYDYFFPGASDFILSVLPFDNAIHNPIQTLQRYVEIVSLWPRGVTSNSDEAAYSVLRRFGIIGNDSPNDLVPFLSSLLHTKNLRWPPRTTEEYSLTSAILAILDVDAYMSSNTHTDNNRLIPNAKFPNKDILPPFSFINNAFSQN